MNRNSTRTIEQSFLDWSGGFPPDSEQQIFIYMEYVYGADAVDADETRDVLRDWLLAESIDHNGL
ncbi:MAG: hypothetical protein ABFC63_03885 [Thermoguttaceae bacterium]